MLQTYTTGGLTAYPPPGSYTGNPYDFVGEQTFSDADGWDFAVSVQYGSQIIYRLTRPDLSQQGYYGQYGTFSHPPFGTPGVASSPFTVGDYSGDHSFPVIAINGTAYDSTKLQILAISFDPITGALTSLAADFVESQPTYPGSSLYGQLRYNSDVPLGAGRSYVLFDHVTYAASESAGGVAVSVQRQGGTDSAVSVNYAVTGGTATPGVDYTPVSGTLTWAAGDGAPKTIYLPILQNSAIEGARTVSLALTGDNLGATAQTTVTIAQDALPPSLLHFRYYGTFAQDTTQISDRGFTFDGVHSSKGSVFPYTDFAVESTPGNGPLQEEDLTFFGHKLAVGNYTADYNSVFYGSLSGFHFNGPAALQTAASEDWQILMVNYGVDKALLQLAANFEVLDAAGQPLLRGEIRYHSSLPLRGAVELATPTFTGKRSASQVQLTAVRQGDTADVLSVNYATTDYSAHHGTDYTAVQGTLTWAAGESGSKTFAVPLLSGGTGGDRIFFVDLSGDSVGNIASAAVTIVDDSRSPVSLLPEPDGQVDATYTPFMVSSAGVSVDAIHPLPNGGALVGGNFLTVGGHVQPGIVRLDAAGTPDFSFRSPLVTTDEPEVDAIAVQTDGKVLIAGRLLLPGNVPGVTTRSVSIVRLNPDGGLDQTFKQEPSDSDGAITSLALQPDGRVVIGGSFSAGSGLARLNANGSLDASFAVPKLDYLDAHPVVLLQPDGKVLAIDSYGILKRYLADGTLDDTYFSSGDNFDRTLTNSAVLQPDGKLILVAGTSTGTLVRLNRDGTLDTGFTEAADARGQILEIESLAMQPDGKLLVGFLPVAPATQNPTVLIRLNPDGSVDDGFTASASLPSTVSALALEADDGLLLSAGETTDPGQNVLYKVSAALSGDLQGPVVALNASVALAGGDQQQTGQFLLTIPTAQSIDLNVAYLVKGTGINGTDYVYLKGQAKIKAGRTSRSIKVVPQGDLGGLASRTVKLVLSPGTGYTVGAASKAKVTIAGPTP